MSKKFLTLDVQTGKRELSTAIVDRGFEVEEQKGEVAYSVDAIDQLLSEVDGDVTLSQDFRVTGVSVGNFNDGTVIKQGTTVLELLQQMLQKQIPPTYTKPTISVSGTQTVEAGTTVTANIVPTFKQNDGGAVTKYVVKKNGSTVMDETSVRTYTEANLTVGDGTLATFNSTVTYADGAIKNDNFGKPYPSTSIKAGSITSNNVTLVGQRKRFWTTDSESKIPTTSDEIRASKNSALNPAAGNTMQVIIPAGGTRAIFAYPATLRDVSSVKYVELGNGEVKDTFQKYIIKVAGANGYNPIDYKVYVYVSAVPAAGQMTYNVTI